MNQLQDGRRCSWEGCTETAKHDVFDEGTFCDKHLADALRHGFHAALVEWDGDVDPGGVFRYRLACFATQALEAKLPEDLDWNALHGASGFERTESGFRFITKQRPLVFPTQRPRPATDGMHRVVHQMQVTFHWEFDLVTEDFRLLRKTRTESG